MSECKRSWREQQEDDDEMKSRKKPKPAQKIVSRKAKRAKNSTAE